MTHLMRKFAGNNDRNQKNLYETLEIFLYHN